MSAALGVEVTASAVLWGDGCSSPIPWPSDYEPTDFVRETVGATFHAWDGNDYKCVAYAPRSGFWMVLVGSSTVATNVSERAIGRTYHKRRV